jgi:copper transport protein
VRRFAASLAIALAAIVATAAPAYAHATLVATEPAAGAKLDGLPSAVTLTFNEAVEVALGGIRVYDAKAQRIVTPKPTHPGGSSSKVAVTLPALDDGSYVVTWRVVSADSHPVHGAFTFHVGTAASTSDTGPLAKRLLNADTGSRPVGVASGLARFAAFAGLVVLVGGAAFALTLWPGGLDHPRTRTLLWSALLTCAIATAAGIALQGATGAGLGLGAAFKPTVLRDVAGTRYGTLALARLGLLALAAGWLAFAPKRTTGAVIGLALLATPGLAGHAAAGDLAALALTADVAHLAAVSIWLGGLVLLTTAVLTAGSRQDWRDPAVKTVQRFSDVALMAVVVIVVTGTFQGWRQVASIPGLTGTTYGRLLLVKVGLFVVMVGLAYAGRKWVRKRKGGAEPPLAKLRRSVAAEAVVAVVILAVTAGLVDATPAKVALARPYSTELTTPKLLIDLTLDPAKAGPVALHLYTLTPEGAQRAVEEMTARLTLAQPPVGPIDIPLVVAGPGHYVVYGFDLPLPGKWRLDVIARLTDIDQVQASTTVNVR